LTIVLIYLSVRGLCVSTTWEESTARPASEFLDAVFLRAQVGPSGIDLKNAPMDDTDKELT
jgi:hypothetical protein